MKRGFFLIFPTSGDFANYDTKIIYPKHLTVLALFFSMGVYAQSADHVKELRKNNPLLYSGFKGSFIVSENGSSVYDLPLNPTPGIGGMTPQISIGYNSNNTTSVLGEGWALNGFSFVSRTGSIQAIDDVTQPVLFNEEDNLQLDGQRLIPITPELHGKNQCVYTTENNTFKRITIAKNQNNTISDIEFFKVETKDGLEYYYGDIDKNSLTQMGLQNIASTLGANGLKGIVNTRTSSFRSTPFLWLATLIIDKNKNWIYFTYNLQQNFYAPKEIFYGAAEALPSAL